MTNLRLSGTSLLCPLLAQSRHTYLHCTCLLSGVKRTWLPHRKMSAKLPISALMPALFSLAGCRTSPMCRVIVLSGPLGRMLSSTAIAGSSRCCHSQDLAQSPSLFVASLEFAGQVATSCSIFSHRSNVDWVTLYV